jgi:hypothetical protein
MLSNEQLELYRQMLPKNMFTTEYLGEFLDSESIVFGDFKECIGYDSKDFRELYIGIDWGSGVGADDTVVCALNERCEEVFLLYFNNKSAAQQVDYIMEYLKPYMSKIKMIVAETNGVGQPLVDGLKLALDGKIKVTEYQTTNAGKIKLINQLQVAFEQRRISILDDEKQTNELSMYEAKVKDNGTVTFNAPIGGNDDIVMALMFALEAMTIKNKTGKYKISVI